MSATAAAFAESGHGILHRHGQTTTISGPMTLGNMRATVIRRSQKDAEIADRPARRAAWREAILQLSMLAVLVVLASLLVPAPAVGTVKASILMLWFFGIAVWSTRAEPPVRRSLMRKIMFGLGREESAIPLPLIAAVMVAAIIWFFAK
jgi:hypothetical protein